MSRRWRRRGSSSSSSYNNGIDCPRWYCPKQLLKLVTRTMRYNVSQCWLQKRQHQHHSHCLHDSSGISSPHVYTTIHRLLQRRTADRHHHHQLRLLLLHFHATMPRCWFWCKPLWSVERNRLQLHDSRRGHQMQVSIQSNCRLLATSTTSHNSSNNININNTECNGNSNC